MSAPYHNLRSKLNRALVAYLVSQSAGDAASVVPFASRLPKEFNADGVVTIVRARMGRPDTKFTGNYSITAHLIIRGSAAQDPSAAEPGDEAARKAFDERIAKTYDAMMQSSDGQTLRWTAYEISDQGRALATSSPADNADMADFTVLRVEDGGFGDPDPNEQDHIWEEVLVFEITCCASNIPGYTNIP